MITMVEKKKKFTELGDLWGPQYHLQGAVAGQLFPGGAPPSDSVWDNFWLVHQEGLCAASSRGQVVRG